MGLEDAIVFTSLGMLILDDVYLPSRETLKDVVGGSGAYGRSSQSAEKDAWNSP